MSSSASNVLFVDSLSSLQTFLLTLTTFDLTNKGSSIPSLFIDLEGAKLSRYGTISLLTLFLFPNNTTYLIDITTLGALAFTTPSSIHPDTTFKSILQDASIPKVFFDVRNDSDALFHHFQISLAGIIDLQLLELGSRVGGLDQKRTVCGLARCIKTDAQLTPAEKKIWETTKEKGGLLFAPEKGGRYEVFDERPLSKEMVDYCVQDVRFLPGLWNVYTKRLGDDGKWKGLIEDATLERVRDSQGKGYVPDSKMKVFGPWTKGPAPSRG
ncbi:ribonuclease H-like domain-containing protein [Cadophora sp. MPI-SDFR-AT-0126]|nr:ribonuclease H-like domain-containing protein [Leotiomycetes sp. MPI-SDFR-AT-0126]